jgi:hypothetical protein
MIQALRAEGTWSGTIVVAEQDEARPRPSARRNTLVVTTPLEVIARLELARDEIGTVVLTGAAEANQELATFLAEAYPCLRVVAGLAGDADDGYLPAFA